MKKMTVILLAAVLLSGMMSVTASARHGYGHRGNAARTQTRYAPCPVAECTQNGIHEHNDVYYCPSSGAGYCRGC